MTKLKKCGVCGKGDLVRKSIRGERFAYKSFPSYVVNEELLLTYCSQCEDFVLASNDPELLDNAIENSIKNEISLFIKNILERTSWAQNEFADFVGFTAIYISELKNRKRVPEFRTYNYLKLLSECFGALECVVENDPRCEGVRDSYHFIGSGSLERWSHAELSKEEVTPLSMEAADSFDDIEVIAA